MITPLIEVGQRYTNKGTDKVVHVVGVKDSTVVFHDEGDDYRHRESLRYFNNHFELLSSLKAKGEALAAEIELTCQTIAVFARAAHRAGRALLNIGLKVGNGPWGTALPVFSALRTVRHYGGTFRNSAIRQSGTEDTLVIDLDEPLNARVLAELASALNQEAIAQWSSHGGWLAGPKAELWGPFDPGQFLLLDGRKLSEVDTNA